MNGEVAYQNQNRIADPLTGSFGAQVSATDNETTRQLTRIWQDLLGIPSIGLDQNYFDIGGDSPLAVQLFAQIEKVFKVKLPLATLFEAPTIELLAQILRGGAQASGWSPLVSIQSQGSRPPFFCIHPHRGNVLIYRDLSRHLGSDQPFYGLQSRGLDGSCAPLTRIEEMAALYIKEIRKVQPHGPYFLGGYCMGGTVAYEIAQQFRAGGEQIALLVMIDSMNWAGTRPPSILAKGVYTIERFIFHTSNFLSLDSEDKADFFREKVKVLRSRVPVWRSMLVDRFYKNSQSSMSEARVLGQIWDANFHACLDYTPRPYPGTVTDIRPARQFQGYDKPELKWDRLAQRGQEVVVLPVNPLALVIEPYVKHLAVAVRKSIDGAIQSFDATKSSCRTRTEEQHLR
jgi:phthiocerol/phenolphthiocerol synthesis type-I polyketide synthase E